MWGTHMDAVGGVRTSHVRQTRKGGGCDLTHPFLSQEGRVTDESTSCKTWEDFENVERFEVDLIALPVFACTHACMLCHLRDLYKTPQSTSYNFFGRLLSRPLDEVAVFLEEMLDEDDESIPHTMNVWEQGFGKCLEPLMLKMTFKESCWIG